MKSGVGVESEGGRVFHKVLNSKCWFKVRTPKKGTSLIEVMLAISVLAIVVLGTAFFSFYTSGRVGLGKQHRAALQLAGQKMEQLRADNEVGIGATDGETTEEVSSGDLSYTRTTTVEDSGLCKEVTVTVSWSQMRKDRNVSLVSLFVGK
jgi:prepilin-type N-terminal cleavage/methylation domain-containing protein